MAFLNCTDGSKTSEYKGSINSNSTKSVIDMEWLYLLISYLPVISIVVGLALLIAGFIFKKSKRQVSNGFLISGGVCIGAFLLICIALFLIGALGIGPVPN